MTSHTLIAFEAISKVYGNGTRALTDVSFSVARGVIHAICGENGAGKSTLMKILFGLEQPSAGHLRFDDGIVDIRSPAAAADLGIGMVHQHFTLVPSLTVAENIFLGQERRNGLFVDRLKTRQRVAELSRRFNLAVDPDARVSTLSVAAQQKVEILKALSRDIRLLILDEPTAVLSPPETEELFARLRHLRDEGLTILFISHKLREVRALASHVTVLRAGRVAGDADLAHLDNDAVSKLVMGASAAVRPARIVRTLGSPLVTLRGVSQSRGRPGERVEDIDLTVHASEIVGVAGVDGSGQQGLVALLSGRRTPFTGDIVFSGRAMNASSTRDWRAQGLAHLPADRLKDGSSATMSLVDNAIAGAHRKPAFRIGAFLNRRKMVETTKAMIAEFGVRCPGPEAPLSALSGGNAQKLIAAREFASQPKFLVADEPTRGIDVAAAAFLHDRIRSMAATGVGVLLVTSDLDELLALSDRVVVMFGGRIVARLENSDGLTPDRLGPYMLGLEETA
ncbi:MAG: ABC transporter ATP-binding protein [Devosia sp.]|uniref:ABC transporter ATP-binding protein n=1 Tax=Devosia sp. TaxID=1871048 RepID=UPI00339B33F2